MYILIEITHIAKEESASVRWVDSYAAYDDAKLALNNEVAERLTKLSAVDDRWVEVNDDKAHVSDEFCNSWDWMLFGTEDTTKTFALDTYAWGMEEED